MKRFPNDVPTCHFKSPNDLSVKHARMLKVMGVRLSSCFSIAPSSFIESFPKGFNIKRILSGEEKKLQRIKTG